MSFTTPETGAVQAFRERAFTDPDLPCPTAVS